MSLKMLKTSLVSLISLVIFLLSVLMHSDSAVGSSVEIASIIIMFFSILTFFVSYLVLALLITKNHKPKGDK